MPRNPQDILCGGMPDLGRFRVFLSTCNQYIHKFISTNVFNIYRYLGHIHALLRTTIMRDFERNIELTRIKFIINRIMKLSLSNKYINIIQQKIDVQIIIVFWKQFMLLVSTLFKIIAIYIIQL